MDKIPRHTHNGQDSNQLQAKEALENCPQPAVLKITQIATSVYGANEQAMLSALKASLNDIIDKLKTVGITL